MSKSQECFDWKQNGNCKYGENCRFLHGSDSTLGSRRKQEQLCFTFRDTGACEFGADCRFSHDLKAAATTTAPKPRRARGADSAPAAAPAESKGDAPRKPRRRNRGPKENRAEDGSAPAAPKLERKERERIPVPQGVEGGRLECLHWKQSKECPYGQDCRYLHDGEPTRGSRRKDELVCFTFRDSGACKFGDDCRYSHLPGASKETLEREAPRAAKAPRAKKVCRDFAAGKCEYGDKCRFLHEKSDDQE